MSEGAGREGGRMKTHAQPEPSKTFPKTHEAMFEWQLEAARERIAHDGEFGHGYVLGIDKDGHGSLYIMHPVGRDGPKLIATAINTTLRRTGAVRYILVLDGWTSNDPRVKAEVMMPADAPDRRTALSIGACTKDRVLAQNFVIDQSGEGYVLTPVSPLMDTSQPDQEVGGRFFTLLSEHFDPMGRRVSITQRGEVVR